MQSFREALYAGSPSDFSQVLSVNCAAVYYTVLAFLDLLDAGNKKRNVSQDSQVIVTGSIAGFSRQIAQSFAYASSKAAVTHLVKTLATSFAQNRFRIRVNLIAPGLYPSEMTTSATGKMEKFGGVDDHPNSFEGAHVMDVKASPAGRTGSEQDLAGTILFMASSAGAYLNGETLLTDGGRLSQLPAAY